MSNISSDNSSNDGLIDDDYLGHVGMASEIYLPPMVDIVVFYIISIILHLLQMKGLFGGLSYDDVNGNIRNFYEVFQPFYLSNISQNSIKLRFFLFSLRGDATIPLEELLEDFITS